jgi:pyrophosphatase PpaX
MQSRKAVLFDLDGTLIDTLGLILESFRQGALDVLGREVSGEQVRSLIGIPLIEQARSLAPDHVEELMAAYRQRNVELHDSMIRYFEGTREMLEALKVEDRRLAVVTSKRNGPALEGLASFDLQGYFEFISGLEETEKHKPDPEPLLVAARRLGLPITECIYVGDSIYDMRAARAAGTTAVGVLWGVATRKELLEAGAEHLASSPHELPAVLRLIG